MDLYGDELAQPIEVFQPVYAACKERVLRLTAHVGEWGSAADVARAVEVLELDAVLHGIAAARSPSVMRLLAEQRATLNICPTSNMRLGPIEQHEKDPIRTLFDAGVKVTVNTDDALVLGVGVSEEHRCAVSVRQPARADARVRCAGPPLLRMERPAPVRQAWVIQQAGRSHRRRGADRAQSFAV